MTLIPFEDRVIIRQDEGQKVTDAGIHIPDAYRQKPGSGVIVAIGPGKPEPDQKPLGYFVNDEFYLSLEGVGIKPEDRIIPLYALPFKKGDHVYFAKYAGTPIDNNGEEFLCMRFTDLISRD